MVVLSALTIKTCQYESIARSSARAFCTIFRLLRFDLDVDSMLYPSLSNIVVDGPLYGHIVSRQEWSTEARGVAERTVEKLLTLETTSGRPGMLLGKIQSGKTRMFLGVIALAFDSGYDVAVILTKGTKALAQQTVKRVEADFREPVEDHEVRVFDIMSVPPDLARAELRAKMILVVKKEDDNLRRLESFLFDQYPELGRKRILLVDDEADFASIGFRGKKGNVEQAVIAKLINDLRDRMTRVSFLQVTATPYSLYLQPDDTVLNAKGIAKPTRPAFTELVPSHPGYVGGDVYFEEAQQPGSVASYLFVPVADEELLALKQPDGRRLKLEDVLTSSRCERLREALAGFLMGAAIARLRDNASGQRKKNYSFVIHTEQAKGSHGWQATVVKTIIDKLRDAGERGTPIFQSLLRGAYDRFLPSLEADHQTAVPFDEALAEATENLDSIAVQVVNSEKQLDTLLDGRGQLRLRNKLNFFIGGQILDRGLTIDHMIGFYYGRNPKNFQQDTVLQHSRMYGARARQDLPVTRFYTAPRIYTVMASIHDMDSALRRQIEEKRDEGAVVFIRRDGRQVVPCSPNKIRLSSLTTLSAGKRMAPVGFQTLPKTRLAREMVGIDKVLDQLAPKSIDRVTTDIPIKTAIDIINRISVTLVWEDQYLPYEWDHTAFLSALEYTASETGRVALLVRRGSSVRRIREGGRPQNSPETGTRETELAAARAGAIDRPLLVLLRHDGTAEGWNGGPFWWPILYAPTQLLPVVYCADAYEDNG